MADLTYFMLGFVLDPIESAYKAGVEYLNEKFAIAEQEYEDLLRSAKADGRDLYEFDEETGQGFDIGEHAYYQQIVIEGALQAHRQAFSIMIHHAWEKHACFLLHVPEYQCAKAYGELEKKCGLIVDRARLERLRKTANCIKHENAKLYDDHPEMFEAKKLNLFDSELSPSERRKDERVDKNGMRGDWLDALQLSDEDIFDFVDAVRKSALKRDAFAVPFRAKNSEEQASTSESANSAI